MKNPLRPMLLVVVAVLGVALLLPAGASTAKKRGIPSQLTYKAMVHIAGGLTFYSHHDSFKNCLPGQRWTLKEASEVEMRGKLLIETYRNQQVRSGSITVPGGAESNNTLDGYEESNYCPPDEPIQLEQPPCKSLTGKGTLNLTPDPRRAGPKRVSIGFGRKTGGNQDLDCTWGLSSRPTPTGSQIEPLGNVFAATVLPLDITIKQLRTLGVKKKLIRTIRVGGDCSRPVVYRGKKIPVDTTDMDDGDCVADGDFVITIKRLNRSTRQSVPLN